MDQTCELWKYLCIIASTFTVFIVGTLSDRCPSIVQRSPYHVETFNEMCYMFVSEEKTWVNANSNCLYMGGDLLIVHNQRTMDFIKSVLTTNAMGWYNKGVWNGANDLKKEGWQWPTGEHLRYSYWAPGEPSSTLFGLVSLENCALMWRNDDWKWHDYHCSGGVFKEYSYRSICQFPFENSHVKTAMHQNQASSHSAYDNDTDKSGIIIGFVVGGGALLVIFIVVLFFLYRQRRRSKPPSEPEDPSVRFQNRSYIPVGQAEGNGETRPLSGVYVDPNEVNRLFEEVTKEVHHGRNINSCTKDHACLSSNETEAVDGAAGTSADLCPTDECCAKTCVISGAGAAAPPRTDAHLTPTNEYVEMGGNGLKSTNLYVKPNKAADESKPSNLDLCHMYSNDTQLVMSDPASEYLHPVESDYLDPQPATPKEPLYETIY